MLFSQIYSHSKLKTLVKKNILFQNVMMTLRLMPFLVDNLNVIAKQLWNAKSSNIAVKLNQKYFELSLLKA